MTQWKTELVPPAPRIAVDHMGEGKLVICMHGIGGNRTNWHDQLPEFGRHFHAGSWDARGYGMSDDYEGPFEFHDFARDLVRVLDHFGARKAHLVGLSMGGLIAMDFNALFPDRVATLTLCDSLPGFGHLSPEQSREFIRLRLEPLLAGKELKEIAPGVAQSLISKSSPPAAFQRMIDSMCALHKHSYIKTIEGSANSGRADRAGKDSRSDARGGGRGRPAHAAVAGALDGRADCRGAADDHQKCGPSAELRAAARVQRRGAAIPTGASRRRRIKAAHPIDADAEREAEQFSRARAGAGRAPGCDTARAAELRSHRASCVRGGRTRAFPRRRRAPRRR